jgi:predicted flap endonuclease-1-like 5' DNA nuclease
MIWALFEIIIPLLLTFLLGLIMGWLLWRWRRRRITVSEWSSHTATARVATEDLEAYRLRHDELAEENARLSAMMKKMGNNLDSRKVELEKETAAATELRAMLQESKSSVANLEMQVANSSQSENELARANNRAKELVGQLDTANDRLDDANARIEELEKRSAQSAELERSLNEANEKLAAAEQHQLRASNLESQLNAATMKLGDLDKSQSEVMSLRSQLADANNKVGESERVADSRVGQLEAQLRAANATLGTSEKLVDELELQLKQANAKLEESDKLKAQAADLAKQANDDRARNHEQGDELAKSKARVAELETNALKLARQAEESSERIAELEKLRSEKGELTSQLSEARSKASELHSAQARVSTLEAQLKVASDDAARSEQQRARISDLEQQLDACKKRSEKLAQAQKYASAQPVNTASGLQVNQTADVQGLQADIAKRDQQIADLERQLAKTRQADHDGAAPQARSTGGWQDTGSWRKGVTKLGTPGSDHRDDLKVISGIGEKMEKLLNSFDIQSWEQLAALTDEEVQTVDAALSEFPGRIERDEWVLQAQEIMANGHVPPDKKAKKQKRKPADKPAPASDWRSGTTHFGTPGSSHSDDLKEINGIGPVLEKTLNDFGIKSWEQVAELQKEDVDKIDQAIAFPGRIEREEWVAQAQELVKRFPDRSERP